MGKIRKKAKRVFRKRECIFCKDSSLESRINYKDVEMLRRFVSDKGKMSPRRNTGNCAKHQRLVAKQIKVARVLALLPFVNR